MGSRNVGATAGVRQRRSPRMQRTGSARSELAPATRAGPARGDEPFLMRASRGPARVDVARFVRKLSSLPSPFTTPVTDLLADLQAHFADKYELDRELCGGGMSRVFLARDARLDRRVVIK